MSVSNRGYLYFYYIKIIKYKPMEARLNRRDRVRLFLNLIERTVHLKAHFRLYYFVVLSVAVFTICQLLESLEILHELTQVQSSASRLICASDRLMARARGHLLRVCIRSGNPLFNRRVLHKYGKPSAA